MDGNIKGVIEALVTHFTAEKLKSELAVETRR
jgi:hypothetical protein